MNYGELGYMGRYLKDSCPRLSANRAINAVFGLPSVRAFSPSAVVIQQKKLPDVSFYQGVIDFAKMRAQTDALVIRAGQNLWKDSQFDNNWREAKSHGIKRGSYYFYDDRVSPGKQAELWASLLRDDYPEMELWADWENSYGGAYKGLPNVVAFMQRVEQLLPGVKIGLYTGYFFFRENSNAIANASQYAYLKTKSLWLAWYTFDAAQVLIPNPWTSLFMWQFGTPSEGLRYGVQTAEIDMNWLNMTEADFQRRYGVVTPPPVEPGETMKGKVIKLTNIRQSNTQFSADMGDLLAGDLVEWTEEGTGSDGLVWIKLISATHNGAPVRCSDGNTVTGRYCWAANVEEINAPPPAETFPARVGLTIGSETRYYVPE
jgi:GH25 family lysozyme M1 (1,4-beta-N-acetylmuramidase)